MLSLVAFYRIWVAIALILIFLSFIIYTCLAVKDLKVEAMKVYDNLKNNDIQKARYRLSMIVGRDTEKLGRDNIIRATVETIAENCVDAILSPLFYAFIGGPTASIAFKAVSTLDSIYGYKNSKYSRFGWASAKIDEWTNFIPARIAVIFIPLACLIYGRGFKNSFNAIKKYRRNSPSPNSGIPEAAIAGAIGLQLGGEISYGGKLQVKPFIGDKRKDFELKDIIDSINIVYIFSIISLLAGLIFCLIIAFTFFLWL
ncbi:MAG: adenosylcobinamide-phosphate synthase CbiB [Candidatus Humimicrobiaceae bacterium]